jgi:AhpD family alkylhydroperoxidase
MAALNRAAAEAMREAGATACTDVTGFGLFAHLLRMLRPARLGAEILAEALPAFPGAVEALRQGVIPGAVERNREYVGEALRIAPGVDEARVNLGFDAQTSGGLLIGVPTERLGRLCQSLAERGAGAFVIGKISGGAAGRIFIKPGDVKISESSSANIHSMKNPETGVAAHSEGCCADIFKNQAAQSSVAETQRAFGALMRSAQASGALSEKAKELIMFSLVVSSRCQPCFDAHFRRARELGITRAELDEAAWCAIAMGGAPVKMFYQENLEKMLKAER